MPKKRPPSPTMQDPTKGSSVISQAFRRLTPPSGSFDSHGSWTHVYHDVSSFRLKGVQGQLSVQHHPDGTLRVESFRSCSQGYRSYTIAELACGRDELATPSSWQIESKVAKTAQDAAWLNSGLIRRADMKDGVLTLQAGEAQRRVDLPGRYTYKWCLMAAVGQMAKLGTERVEFTLVDEHNELCPKQILSLRDKETVQTRSGEIEVVCYQHTGVATMPGVFYADAAGRVLFYLAGMELLALANVDGKATGYLQ